MGIPALVRGTRVCGALGPAWGTILAIGIVEIAMPCLGGLESHRCICGRLDKTSILASRYSYSVSHHRRVEPPSASPCRRPVCPLSRPPVRRRPRASATARVRETSRSRSIPVSLWTTTFPATLMLPPPKVPRAALCVGAAKPMLDVPTRRAQRGAAHVREASQPALCWDIYAISPHRAEGRCTSSAARAASLLHHLGRQLLSDGSITRT